MSAYYNEFDPYAAAWLRNLIEAGHIAPGDVDERSIADVRPSDLAGYRQCHFFAGIGVWSYALRSAGWSDEREVWTGSCPCQPFSAAGRGAGTDDARHLWPEFFRLISECRPRVVFGEQVASKDGLAWLDAVSSDLEGAHYAIGALDLCAAGFGAPHIRQRLYFVAGSGRDEPLRRDTVRRADGPDAGASSAVQGGGGERLRALHDVADGGASGILADAVLAGRPERGAVAGSGQAAGSRGALIVADASSVRHDWRGAGEASGGAIEPERSRDARLMADSECAGLEGLAGHGDAAPGRQNSAGPAPEGGALGGLANADSRQRRGFADGEGCQPDREKAGRQQGHGESAASGELRVEPDPGPTNGLWRSADWIYCRDGKWRAVEPGTFPLAHGAASRVGRLRAFGNAIVAEQAREFVSAAMDVAGAL